MNLCLFETFVPVRFGPSASALNKTDNIARVF